eukprot:159-Rhodomonas_salina.3
MCAMDAHCLSVHHSHWHVCWHRRRQHTIRHSLGWPPSRRSGWLFRLAVRTRGRVAGLAVADVLAHARVQGVQRQHGPSQHTHHRVSSTWNHIIRDTGPTTVVGSANSSPGPALGLFGDKPTCQPT